MGGPSFLDPGCHLQNFLLGEADRVERDADLAAPCVAAGLASPGVTLRPRLLLPLQP